MKLEKILFLLFTCYGVFKSPVALIPASLIFLYIAISEFLVSKSDKEALKKHINEEVLKLNESVNETNANVQRLKDSIISLKMDRGIKNMTRG